MRRCMTRYATLEEMQKMEFGTHGQKVIGDDLFELVSDGSGCEGWAVIYTDDQGNMIDWDRLPEADAIKLGLWSKPRELKEGWDSGQSRDPANHGFKV